MDWVSAHLFSHGDLDDVVLGLVGPLVATLGHEGLTRRWFFLRYWDGGPHVRLRVLAEPGRRGDVERALTGHAETYFAAHASADRVTGAEYARYAPALATHERTVAAAALYPNNSLQLIPYQPEHDRYGYGAVMDSVEMHFAESSRLTLDLLARGPTRAERHTTALAMLLLSWFTAADRGLAPALAAPATPVQTPGAARSIARSMRRLVDRAGELPDEGTFPRWAWSVARLCDALTRHGRPAQPGAAVDLCAHLACNRLGVDIEAEADLRSLAHALAAPS